MGKYTTYSELWIDEEIEKHLKIAADKIKTYLPQVLSIILAGGFGRGEGSVRLKKEERKVIPINDYDLYLVSQKPIREDRLNEIAKEIEKSAGSRGYSLYGHSEKEFYFDLRLITLDKLKKLPPLIKYYEFKYASTLIFGKDLRKLTPEFSKNNLPFSDGLRFLLNRICHITEWFSANYLKNEPVKAWEKETLIYDMSKTYLECATVLTLLKGYYEATYQKRLEQLVIHQDEFGELWQKFPDLLDKIKYFTGQKLQPNFDEIKDIKKTWFETRDYAIGVLEFVLSEKYKAQNWRDFKKTAVKNYFRPYLAFKLPYFSLWLANVFLHRYLSLIWFFRLIKFRKKNHWRLIFNFTDPGVLIFYASLFLSQTLKKDGALDKQMMAQGIKILKSIYPFKIPSYDLGGYDNLRKIFSDIWRLYYFQKLL